MMMILARQCRRAAAGPDVVTYALLAAVAYVLWTRWAINIATRAPPKRRVFRPQPTVFDLDVSD